MGTADLHGSTSNQSVAKLELQAYGPPPHRWRQHSNAPGQWGATPDSNHGAQLGIRIHAVTRTHASNLHIHIH